MPRHPRPLQRHEHKLSTHEELRNLRLAVQLRTDQVKLRQLEWDTQTLALPHISPLPGDSDLQIRTPLIKDDLPTPRPPKRPPEILAGDSKIYAILLNLYAEGLTNEWHRDPYNWLASISAQEKRDAKR